MRLKVKNESHRYDINRTRPKRGYKYTEDKMCLSMMVVMSNKQHLATPEADFVEKFSNSEAELKKSVVYKKSV